MPYECVLWNNEGSSDKIWGVTDYRGQPVTFWGKRTAKELTFKLVEDDPKKLADKKKRARGYKEISFEKLEELDPGFKERFEGMIVLCIVTDNFHRNPNREDD